MRVIPVRIQKPALHLRCKRRAFADSVLSMRSSFRCSFGFPFPPEGGYFHSFEYRPSLLEPRVGLLMDSTLRILRGSVQSVLPLRFLLNTRECIGDLETVSLCHRSARAWDSFSRLAWETWTPKRFWFPGRSPAQAILCLKPSGLVRRIPALSPVLLFDYAGPRFPIRVPRTADAGILLGRIR